VVLTDRTAAHGRPRPEWCRLRLWPVLRPLLRWCTTAGVGATPQERGRWLSPGRRAGSRGPRRCWRGGRRRVLVVGAGDEQQVDRRSHRLQRLGQPAAVSGGHQPVPVPVHQQERRGAGVHVGHRAGCPGRRRGRRRRGTAGRWAGTRRRPPAPSCPRARRPGRWTARAPRRARAASAPRHGRRPAGRGRSPGRSTGTARRPPRRRSASGTGRWSARRSARPPPSRHRAARAPPATARRRRAGAGRAGAGSRPARRGEVVRAPELHVVSPSSGVLWRWPLPAMLGGRSYRLGRGTARRPVTPDGVTGLRRARAATGGPGSG
jgi:hypothetical protein